MAAVEVDVSSQRTRSSEARIPFFLIEPKIIYEVSLYMREVSMLYKKKIKNL